MFSSPINAVIINYGVEQFVCSIKCSHSTVTSKIIYYGGDCALSDRASCRHALSFHISRAFHTALA